MRWPPAFARAGFGGFNQRVEPCAGVGPGTVLGADALRLLHEHLEHPILGALAVEEEARFHLVAPLLQHRRRTRHFPEHGQRLALGIVVEAGQVHERRFALAARLGDLLDEPAALADERDPARCGRGPDGG